MPSERITYIRVCKLWRPLYSLYWAKCRCLQCMARVDVCSQINKISNKEWSADTSMGLWMSAFRVRFFEDMRLCQPVCAAAGAAPVLHAECQF